MPMKSLLALLLLAGTALHAQPALYLIYGLNPEDPAYADQVAIYASYLRTSYINYPDRLAGDPIYSAVQPAAYVPVNADGLHAPSPAIIAYDATGRAIYLR